MKAALFLGTLLCLSTIPYHVRAQADLPVTGNVVIGGSDPSGNYNNGKDNISGNVNMLGDLVFTGTNPWILHTPNDGRSSLHIAPNQNWANETVFSPNGDVSFSQRVRIGNVSSPGVLGINNLTLAVGGKLGARAVYVVAPTTAWPDYVFHQSYLLPALADVERFVRANGHLPEIPAAATIQAEGLDLGTMDALLLRKVEELTLYMIALKKENEALQARVTQLER